MTKKGMVYYNEIFAGTLEYLDNEYVFRYDVEYLRDSSLPAISLSLPKSKIEYRSPVLFSFFYGLLAEGNDKALQCAILKIDENDHFTRLLRTAGVNTIGAITVREEK